MSSAFVQATQGGYVWLDTPRGMLGGCWKCGSKSMRDCDCYQDRETNDEISKNLDGFHGAGADPGRDSPKSSAVSIGKHGHHHHSKRVEGTFKRTSFFGDDQSIGSRDMHESWPENRGSVTSMSQSGKSAQEQLQELKTWKDQGLIDEQEYKQQKGKVLSAAQSHFHVSTLAPPRDTRPTSSMSCFSTTNERTYRDPREIRERREERQKTNARAFNDAQYSRTSTPSSVSSVTDEEKGHPGVSKTYLDFLFKQLRQICYRKVRGNGNDVSIREIFRHFDSEKHGDAPGVDREEFITAVQRLMLGSPERGIINHGESESGNV